MSWDFHNADLETQATVFLYDAPDRVLKSQEALRHHLVVKMVSEATSGDDPMMDDDGYREFVAEQIEFRAAEAAQQYFDDLAIACGIH